MVLLRQRQLQRLRLWLRQQQRLRVRQQQQLRLRLQQWLRLLKPLHKRFPLRAAAFRRTQPLTAM